MSRSSGCWSFVAFLCVKLQTVLAGVGTAIAAVDLLDFSLHIRGIGRRARTHGWSEGKARMERSSTGRGARCGKDKESGTRM